MQRSHNWDNYFDNDRTGAPYLQFGHSQAAAHIRNALEMYAPERRKRISLVMVAPLAYVSPEICRDVRHYVSKGDFIPFLDVEGRKRCKDTITYLDPHPSANFHDHDFMSPTYREKIQYALFQYTDMLKQYAR
jgi:hypothetical protein